MDIEKIRQKVSPYFSTRSEVQTAYLFGSYAKGEEGPLSDTDLAILLEEKKALPDLPYGYKAHVVADLTRILQTDRIDLVILNESPILLRFQVVREGSILYSKRERTRIQFEAKVMSLYFDQEYYYRRHATANLERIAREGIL